MAACVQRAAVIGRLLLLAVFLFAGLAHALVPSAALEQSPLEGGTFCRSESAYPAFFVLHDQLRKCLARCRHCGIFFLTDARNTGRCDLGCAFGCRQAHRQQLREKRTHVGQLTDEMEIVLNHGGLVILFPEGTSSDGQTVLPFKSSLLEPAARQAHPLSAGLIHYELDDGNVGEEVCYWKDMTLFPHLINLLSKRTIRASVQFTQLRQGSTNRKELARQLHSEVLRLQEAFVV